MLLPRVIKTRVPVAHLWATSRVMAYSANLDIIRNSRKPGERVGTLPGVRLFLGESNDVDRDLDIGGRYLPSLGIKLRRRQFIRGGEWYAQSVR